MKQFGVVGGVLVLFAMVPMLRAQHSFVPGEVLVAPRAADTAPLEATFARNQLEVAERDHALTGLIRVRVPIGRELEWAARLDARDDVAFAETNGTGRGGLVPNDPGFGAAWHLENTGQTGGTAGADANLTRAWDITTGSSNTVIAVLDSGIDTDHPEFVGRIDPDGFDFVNGDADPEDDSGHGTTVTGVLCANANNAFGTTGADWQCKVLPIKVLDGRNGGNTMALAQGLHYAANQPDVQIISMSLIGFPSSSALTAGLTAAREAGKVLIACGGNGTAGFANRSYPGASPFTISIGATTHDDVRASFSATGSALDFVAPGESIVTVQYNSGANATSTSSGCSLATPLTAGIVGLLFARAQVLGLPAPTHDNVFELLRAGAVDQVGRPTEDTPGRDEFHGEGRIDALASLAELERAVCMRGNVGLGGMGGAAIDVLFANGEAVDGLWRQFSALVSEPLELRIDAPPSSATPNFALIGSFGAPFAGVTPLPLGVGDLRVPLGVGPATFVASAGTAPWSMTVPGLGLAGTMTLQGVIADGSRRQFAVTNAVALTFAPRPPPVVLEVIPRAAIAGSAVRVEGTGFSPGLTLQLDGVARAVGVLTATGFEFVVPSTLSCDAPLVVTNPDGQAAVTTFNDTPRIDSIITTGGLPAAGGTTLRLVGENFVPGSIVTVGGTPMPVAIPNPWVAAGALPPGSVGPAQIVLTTPFGCSASTTIQYTP